MALAASNTCPFCKVAYPVGTSTCVTPGCPGHPINFGHSLNQLLDHPPHSLSDIIFAVGDVSLADGLHFLIAPFRIAALSSPYIKVRLTAWEEEPSEHDMDGFPERYGMKRRILTLENRGGWGTGMWGPMKGIANFALNEMTCLNDTSSLLNSIAGSDAKKTKTVDTKFYSWPHHETQESLEMEVFGVDYMTAWAKGFTSKERRGEIRRYTRAVKVEEKNITMADFDTLYDRFGNLPEKMEKPKWLPYMYYRWTSYKTAEDWNEHKRQQYTVEG